MLPEISNDRIEELRALVEEEFGLPVDMEEAREIASRLFGFYVAMNDIARSAD